MKSILFGAAATLAVFVAPAQAQDMARFSAGVTGGTLGVGPELAYRFSPSVGVRGNATFLGVDRNVDSDDIEYDGKLKLASGGLMADVHPFGNGFRLSVGARVNSNEVRLKATPTQNVEVGDTVYTPAQIGVLSGKVKPKSVAPTITLGWAGGMTRGIKFGIEAGAMFHGSPEIDNLRATGSLASNSAFQASLREEEREIEDDIDKYKVYPIVQLSLGYRF